MEKKKVVVQESEVIMVNGNPITLTGEEGDRIKACLLSGKLTEYPQLLNQLLAKAGLLITSDTISAETEVRSSLTTRHSVKVNNDDDDARIHEATEFSRCVLKVYSGLRLHFFSPFSISCIISLGKLISTPRYSGSSFQLPWLT